jgi:hypothetical protein
MPIALNWSNTRRKLVEQKFTGGKMQIPRRGFQAVVPQPTPE